MAGDAANETALAALIPIANSNSAYSDIPGSGYYATSMTNLDMTGNQHNAAMALVDWDLNGCSGASSSACITPSGTISLSQGYTANYIINRLCTTAGDPNASGNSCATYQPTSNNSPKKGELTYGDNKRFTPSPTGYYRMTSRVHGPKDTYSFIEAIIHF